MPGTGARGVSVRLVVLLLGAFIAIVAVTVLAVWDKPSQEANTRAVVDLVERFGSRLQMVSLQGPNRSDQLREAYAEFVTSELLDSWLSDPSSAPGRFVSSPWPERIQVLELQIFAGRYHVNANIIYVTSIQETGREPITLTIERDLTERWRIGAMQSELTEGRRR